MLMEFNLGPSWRRGPCQVIRCLYGVSSSSFKMVSSMFSFWTYLVRSTGWIPLDGIDMFGDDGIPFRSMVEEKLQCFIEYSLSPLIPKDGSNGPSSFGTYCPSWWILRKGLWLGLLYLELVIHLDGDWRKDCGWIFFILIVLLRIW